MKALATSSIAIAWLIASGEVRAQPSADPAPAPPPPPPSQTEPTADDYRDVLEGAPSTVEANPEQPSPTPSSDASDEPAVGAGRVGVYSDTDQTTVLRALATIAKTWGQWTLSGSATVDAVTSASVDVKSSPALGAVDTVTSASGRTSTSGGQMSDTRYQGTLGTGWKDTSGHAVNATGAIASERDYLSASGGLNGSVDILERNATLLGGLTLTDNRISSVLDAGLHRKMFAVGWSAGVARVLTPSDAVRLRYDGKASEGYLSSPYRSVRFGDWTTTTNATGQIMFANTIGTAAGLPELLPASRISHALVLEWVHALGLGFGLHPSVRVSHDTWGLESVTPALELRIARKDWRLQLGYRYYLQSRASFFAGKYTADPSMYTNYTSDKELGSQTGHLVGLDIAKVLIDADNANDSRLLLYAHAEVLRYAYPGFPLLASRSSTFFELGLGWEL